AEPVAKPSRSRGRGDADSRPAAPGVSTPAGDLAARRRPEVTPCAFSRPGAVCYARRGSIDRSPTPTIGSRRGSPIDLGLFPMTSHPPERGLYDGHQWDLQVLRWADELGYREAWIGEHHTAPWEPHPSPDLIVAQALMQTKNIRLGPGGFLLPFHHPAELANRVAMLDQ